MLKPKVVYQERCAVEAESKEGKRYTREISLIAKELWRKDIDSTDVIFLEVEFKNGQKEEKEAMFTSSLKVVRDYFLKKITAAIDLVHPEKRIKIVFPQENKYLKMHRVYCQNCGKFLQEFYGFYEGRVEKCPSCGRLTVFKRTSK